jgi:hypothetical protein
MYSDEDANELPESAGYESSDTEPDDACDVVQAFALGLAREQGGTEHVMVDPTDKGNGDEFDLDASERVNCDPQAFQWNEQAPRSDNQYQLRINRPQGPSCYND